MSAPVLQVWDPARPTRLLTDASELAVSAIVEQPDDAGEFHSAAFKSRKLTSPERSYPPHLLELLAVVHALKTLRPYLLDKPAVPPRQALRAAHRQSKPAMVTAAVPRQPPPGTMA